MVEVEKENGKEIFERRKLMIIFYNAIRGFVVGVVLLNISPTQDKDAKDSSIPCSNRLNENHVERSTFRYYIEYDDYEQHPATGRRTLCNN